LQCVDSWKAIRQYVAVCCSVLQCVAVRCSVWTHGRQLDVSEFEDVSRLHMQS